MILKTADLRTFARAAGNIRTGSIIPVQAFILFEHGTVTKVNESQFVQLETAFDGCLLVDEKLLFSFLKATDAEEITLVHSGKTITISDGTRSVKAPTGDPQDFSRPPMPLGEVFRLPADVIKAIGTCSKFVTIDAMPVKCHVYVGQKAVAGADGEIGYCQEFMDDLPELVLSKSEASLIGGMTECRFSENSHWHFFRDGQLLYGQVKSEALWVELCAKFQAGRDFEVPRQPLADFTDLAVNVTAGTLLVGTMTGHAGSIRLHAEDRDFNINVEQEIPYDGGDFPQFGFGPSRLQRLVRAVPAESYVFAKGQGMYYLRSGNVTTLIMEMK